MKKFTKILGIAAVLLCGLVIMGCDGLDKVKDALSGPKDTWFKRDITYKTGSGDTEISTELSVFMCYSDNASTAKIKNGTLELPSGLNVVVVAKNVSDTNPVIEGLVDGKFLFKNISDTQTTEIETGTDDGTQTGTTSIKMSTTKWNLIYNSVAMENYGNSIPLFGDYSQYTQLTKPTSFSWKKIMRNYVLDQLLDD